MGYFHYTPTIKICIILYIAIQVFYYGFIGKGSVSSEEQEEEEHIHGSVDVMRKLSAGEKANENIIAIYTYGKTLLNKLTFMSTDRYMRILLMKLFSIINRKK